jgi:hypothetical protein
LQIVLPDRFDDDVLFPMTVDGVHCKTYEPMHPTMPMDTEMSSHKFGKKAAFTYELGVSTYEQKLYWTHGPRKGGCNDKRMFKTSGLQAHLVAQGKQAIADSGYSGVRGGGVSTPNRLDTAEVKEFKRRARARHENFNGRIKNFGVLSQTFRHKKNRLEKHQTAFEAVCVIVQYQLENGSPLFEI